MDDIDELIGQVENMDRSPLGIPLDVAARMCTAAPRLAAEVRRLRRELGARVYYQIGKVRRLRARLREQTDETQRAGERIDAAIRDALAHLGIDISDRVGKTPIEQIVGGVVVGLQAEVERLRAVAGSVLSTRLCDDCYEEGCDWECGCVCHRSMKSAQEALRAALAAGGEVRP